MTHSPVLAKMTARGLRHVNSGSGPDNYREHDHYLYENSKFGLKMFRCIDLRLREIFPYDSDNLFGDRSIEKGLVDGSIGTVEDLAWCWGPEVEPYKRPSSILMVRFDTYTGPAYYKDDTDSAP
ncbi:hypothetical protein E4U16_008214, partial [Claviceps sp. LM84 group G4]